MKKVEENTYYDCLYHQFLNETHSKSDIDSIDFIKWIYSKKKLAREFGIFLGSKNEDFIKKSVIEVGKGKHDSISNLELQVISPFGGTLDKNNVDIIIQNGQFVVVNDHGVKQIEKRVLLTHNPYQLVDIYSWKELAELSSNEIIMGMYGKNSDCDKEEKLELLTSLIRELPEDSQHYYKQTKDNYFAVASSLPKRKTLKLM